MKKDNCQCGDCYTAGVMPAKKDKLNYIDDIINSAAIDESVYSLSDTDLEVTKRIEKNQTAMEKVENYIKQWHGNPLNKPAVIPLDVEEKYMTIEEKLIKFKKKFYGY